MKKLTGLQVAVADLVIAILATISVIAMIPFALSYSNVEGSGGGLYPFIAPLMMLVFVVYTTLKKRKCHTK